MKQLKQILLTLALLITAATGAWAQEETLLTTIVNTADGSVGFTSGSKTFDNIATVTFSGNVENDYDDWGWYTYYGSETLTVTAAEGYTITRVKFYNKSGSAFDEEAPFEASLVDRVVIVNGNSIGQVGVTKIEVYGYAGTPEPAASTTVNLTRGTGDKANEWTMDGGMPAGNVTVSVEYYDYAELTAADAIAANNAARAQTDDLLATVAENPATGGTLMYYLTTDATFTQAQALALAETDWSSTVPTAEDIDGAGATVYLWYYIKGDDEHSDTDPVQLTVNVQPEPTYNVTFAEGTDLNEWNASPNADVKKGQTVTVTYSGTKKVIGVKAEKKAAEPISLIVNPEVGQVIGADGKNYADAAAATAAGTTAVAKICYVGSDNGEAAPYNHGLALALSDAGGGSLQWSTSTSDAGHTKQTDSNNFTSESGLQYNATHNSDTYPAFKAAIANNSTAAPTGCSAWFLASGYQWTKMFAGDAGGLKTLAGLQSYYYWSSSERNANAAWVFRSYDGDWDFGGKVYDSFVRSCLAF